MSIKEFKALFPKALAQSLSHLKTSFKFGGPFLLAVFLGSFLLNAFAQSLMTGVMNQTYVIAICIMVVSDMLASFLFLIVLPSRIQDVRSRRPLRNVMALTKSYGGDMAAEMLRVASGMLFGLLMGIIPGILRSLRWILVPYVVVADPQYAKGERDALEHSASLSKGLLMGMALLWLAFFFIDMGLYQIDQAWWNLQKADSVIAWGGSIVINFISTLATIYSILLYFAIYEVRQAAQGDKK